MSKDCDSLNKKDIYKSIPQLITNAESVTWSRFNAYLLAISILILGWVTLFTTKQIPQGLPVWCCKALLIIISLFGMFMSTAWSILGFRGRAYLNHYIALGRELEEERDIKSGPCHDIEKLRDYLNGLFGFKMLRGSFKMLFRFKKNQNEEKKLSDALEESKKELKIKVSKMFLWKSIIPLTRWAYIGTATYVLVRIPQWFRLIFGFLLFLSILSIFV